MSDYYNKEGSLEPEHEASDPIKTPVQLLGRQILDSDRQGVCEVTVPFRMYDTTERHNDRLQAIGEHIALCINERPQLLAETLRLRQEVEELKFAIQQTQEIRDNGKLIETCPPHHWQGYANGVRLCLQCTRINLGQEVEA